MSVNQKVIFISKRLEPCMYICLNACNREVYNSGAGGSTVHWPVYDGQGETTRTCKENTVLCQSNGGMFAGVRVVLP